MPQSGKVLRAAGLDAVHRQKGTRNGSRSEITKLQSSSGNSSMTDQWYYRMFGEEFGPVAVEKLREMADKGTVGASDEVRSARSNRWVSAGSVEELGLSLSSGDTATAVATTSDSDAMLNVSSERTGLDDWYCLLNGSELGPLNFDELLKYAKHEQLSADDEVKLGANGKWRRVGSIGRLMAVLPYRAPTLTTVTPANRSKTPATERPVIEERVGSNATATPPAVQIDLNAAYQAAYEQAKAQITQSMLAQAEAAFKQAEENAKAEIAWASAPNVDPQWWGWMGGIEFGPVAFAQVFALAKHGQLKPADFLRNGPHGQMFPSSSAPGLYSAVAAIAKATETLGLAKLQAQAAADLAAPAPVAPSIPMTAPRPVPTAVMPSVQGTGQTAVATRTAESFGSSAVATQKAAGSRSQPKLSAVSDPPQSKVEPNVEAADEGRVLASPPVTARPAPSTSSVGSNYSSAMSMSSSSSYGSSRPAAMPVRPTIKPSRSRNESSFSFSEMLEPLKEPKALGAVGIIASVLLCFGWMSLPKSSAADVKNFHELKHIVDEIKQKRSSNSTDFASVNTKADRIGKAVVAELAKKASRDEPAKQQLLWAARDRMPVMLGELKKAPAETSKAEQGFIECLREAARLLRIKEDGLPPAPPRPPVDPNAGRDD